MRQIVLPENLKDSVAVEFFKLHLWPLSNKYPGYGTKQSDGRFQ